MRAHEHLVVLASGAWIGRLGKALSVRPLAPASLALLTSYGTHQGSATPKCYHRLMASRHPRLGVTRDPEVELATDAHTPPLRAMNAIHLATALTMREDLGAMFVYDTDLHAAAQAHDLNPLAPA